MMCTPEATAHYALPSPYVVNAYWGARKVCAINLGKPDKAGT
jgi:hypothetical protein